MKRCLLFTTVLLMGLAKSLHANTYLPFDVTQVIVTVSPLVGGEDAFFSVLGPGTNHR
jgi:hypothetical protein